MKLLDVNVLIALHRSDAPDHAVVTSWFERERATGGGIGLAVHCAVGVARICSNPRAFADPSPVAAVFDFLRDLTGDQAVRRLAPGPRHLQVLERLCREYDVRGKLVSDAHLAALAVEHAATVVSFDRDFARFTEVGWELPTAPTEGARNPA